MASLSGFLTSGDLSRSAESFSSNSETSSVQIIESCIPQSMKLLSLPCACLTTGNAVLSVYGKTIYRRVSHRYMDIRSPVTRSSASVTLRRPLLVSTIELPFMTFSRPLVSSRSVAALRYKIRKTRSLVNFWLTNMGMAFISSILCNEWGNLNALRMPVPCWINAKFKGCMGDRIRVQEKLSLFGGNLSRGILFLRRETGRYR